MIRIFLSTLFFIAFEKAIPAQSNQVKNYKIHTVAFYNLENLFDIEDDTSVNDEASPIMEMAEGLRKDAYDRKLANMARVISNIGANKTGTAPSILGVCEVENRKVIEDLINHPLLVDYDYGIEHYNSPDRRGIDVALIYKKSEFKINNSQSRRLLMNDRLSGKPVYSRDQLVVSGELNGDEIYLIVNHWPSRSGGEQRSRYKRVAAAALNNQIIDSLHISNPMAKILTMGDLNDDPISESVQVILNAQQKKKNVKPQMIFNPYVQMFKEGYHTLSYRDAVNIFDQIMFTYPLLKKANQEGYFYYHAGIYNPSFMSQNT
ncbi:MAG: endonuclease/exonuclease/phosphatase family protein, partial [Bacteroidota bacterium]